MKYNMYSVKDELTGKFMNPMFTDNDEHSESLAIRQFASNVNEIPLWKNNPNDYSLYLVGTFDDVEGAAAVPLTKIIDGRSVINGSKN